MNIKTAVASLSLLLLNSCMPAFAATSGSSPGSGSYGVTDVQTTATEVFTQMTGRNAVAIQNLGADPLYCGWNSSVTANNGFQVPVGAVLSIDITAGGSGGSNTARLFCLAANNQSSPNNTRWLQVK